MNTSTQNKYSVEVQEAIKLVCTNPASTFMPPPMPMDFSLIRPRGRRISGEEPNSQHPRRMFNAPIQGFFADLELFAYANAVAQVDQAFYDQMRELAAKCPPIVSPRVVPDRYGDVMYSRAIREHADNVWLWQVSDKRIKFDDETVEALTVHHSLKPRPVKGPERG